MNNIDLDDLRRWAYAVSHNLSNAGKQSNALPLDDSHLPIMGKVYAIVLNDDGIDVRDKKVVLEAVLNKWAAVFLSCLDSTITPNARKIILDRQKDFKKNWSAILDTEFDHEIKQLLSFKIPKSSSRHKM